MSACTPPCNTAKTAAAHRSGGQCRFPAERSIGEASELPVLQGQSTATHSSGSSHLGADSIVSMTLKLALENSGFSSTVRWQGLAVVASPNCCRASAPVLAVATFLSEVIISAFLWCVVSHSVPLLRFEVFDKECNAACAHCISGHFRRQHFNLGPMQSARVSAAK